jgi:hypothetical protein
MKAEKSAVILLTYSGKLDEQEVYERDMGVYCRRAF